MLFIYTKHKTSRLDYIIGHLFGNVIGVDYALTDDPLYFSRQQGILINYSNDNIGKGIQIIPHGLLFETDINPVKNISPSMWDNLFCFFSNKKGDIPFDIFSASFYLLTRYEEYLPGKLDKYLRFDPKESTAVKYNFLETPLVDRWVHKLCNVFKNLGYDTSAFNLRSYKMVSTFDIDIPFIYRNKGLLKNLLGIAKDLLKKDFPMLHERIKTVLHLQDDPVFKTLYWLERFHGNFNRHYHLFVLNGSYNKFDRTTIYPLRRYYKHLRTVKGATIGLHPSFYASFTLNKIKQEKERLEKRIGKMVTTNRQHYLRMQIPKTQEQLNSIGITEDFTMTYATLPGFRASTAIPFFFYNLYNNTPTTLLIRPTIIMDATLITHLNLAPEQALKKIKLLANECKLSGGDFTMLWHNSNLAGSPEKNPWINVFIKSFKYALSLESNNFGG